MTDLSTFAAIRAALAAPPAPYAEARGRAEARNGQLTKPPGALGRLEAMGIWLAGWQGTDHPAIRRPQIAVFAGNHGVTAQGVSAFPPEVTAQMVANFAAGGAAINVLARAAGATLTVTPLDLDRPTADFTQGPAMTEAETAAAFAAGWAALSPDTDLLVVGEMGIGNTTAAAAICAALLGGDWVGRGTGVDEAGLTRKRAAVTAGLAANPGAGADGLAALSAVGGREIAAMAGAMAAARIARVPVLLDGFIASAAALVLARIGHGPTDHLIAGHVSAEGAHARLLQELGLNPILDLGLRLGEGSGAALAIPVLRSAAACLSEMATFAEAGVSAG